jgi:diaminohydroxyphosphoribosylaminopyrimidine deaminase/5-amino-6-(5-phosphoribosylamino)uracil reductase
MRAALALARRGLGTVSPNPAVGCVLVRPDRGGMVVGRGWTQPGGRPHGETEALRRAATDAKTATAYVTLEPCSHHGQTPPCADALIEAGIARAVIALEDPDPKVSGRGIARLQDAGITVVTGVCAEEAARLNAGFFLRTKDNRPMFTLKTATTLDGRIATRTGDSRWITGAPARAMGHRLRADHDAVMTGIGTVLADDPDLTCRLPGLEHRSPIRIVVDSRLRLPSDCRLATTADRTPTWLVASSGAAPENRGIYVDLGIEIIDAETDSCGRPDLRWLARELGRRGLTRILVEGGGTLAAALLSRDMIDQLAWFRAPRLIGGDGLPAAAPLGIDTVSDTPTFTRTAVREIGADILETYYKQP